MPMRSESKRYINLSSRDHERDSPAPWYWRLIALAASWMILGGYVAHDTVGAGLAPQEAMTDFGSRYLILPGLYAKDPQLKFSQAALSVFVVALLTAGYSFTALLCFACRNEMFQAEAVFLYDFHRPCLPLLNVG
jgi:hypothetical protein